MMKKIYNFGKALFLKGFFLILLSVTAFTAEAQQDSKGTDFWLMFDGNYPGLTPESKLYLTSSINTTGTISVPGLSYSAPFTVTANQVTVVTLPAAIYSHTSNVIDTKGVHVTASNDVTVYGLNYYPASTDAYLGLPTDVLGTDYTVLSYTNSQSYSGTFFGIVATVNGTTVTIVPSVTTGTRTVGVPYTIVMNQGQTYELSNVNTPGDLTGTTISATAPIGVMAGAQCANIPTTAGACDHICEMLPSRSTWGKQFAAVPLKARVNGDTWRFLASENGTIITINGVAEPMINTGQFREKILTANSYIQSNKPILVAQYANGASFSGDPGDPFMMLIPPLEQFLANYTVSNVSGYSGQYINVVAPTSIAGSITIDGTPIPSSAFTAIGSSGYAGAQVTTTTGSHTLNGSLPFGVFAYGFNSYDSYGYPGGQSFSPVASVTNLAVSPLSGSGALGTPHCLNATVTDQNNAPLSGILVNFAVTGANTVNGFATTNASGVAQYCYTGINAGNDNIGATTGSLTASATFTWLPPCAPAITCPGNLSQNTSAGNCSAAVSYSASATGGTPMTYTYSTTGATTASGSGSGSGIAFNKGITNVTVTANNSCGTANCTFTVTVNDNEGPTFSVPAAVTVNGYCGPGAPAADVSLGTPSNLADNCGTAGLTTGNNAPATFFPVGTTTVTWTVSDGTNSTTHTQLVTVNSLALTATSAVAPLYPLPGQEIQTVYLGYPGCAQSETITMTPTNGTAPYTYVWTRSACNSVLPAGFTTVQTGVSNAFAFSPSQANICTLTLGGDNVFTFNVIATDAHGCSNATPQTKKVNVVNPYSGADVLVCHRNVSRGSTTTQMMTLAPSAVATHLAHGDYLGNCLQFTGARQMAQGLEDNHPILISPNPTTGSFKVELHEIIESADIIIADVQGKIIARKTLSKDGSPVAEFSLHGYSAGMYLISVKDGEMVYRTKIVLR